MGQAFQNLPTTELNNESILMYVNDKERKSMSKAIIVGGCKPPGPKASQVTWTPNTKTFIKTIYIVIFSYIRRQI